ncbi:hypothetical protein AB0D13_09940 [Streptomyces sp. NPDC048430]|uniref:hypothetical protein n=1 Tax=Streptomyces sp. NPDC048430 TaxID=3155388 RepID=UPI00342AFB77
MGQLKKANVAAGPVKDLNEALHRLHLEAGEPSLPRMAAAWRKGYKPDGNGRYKTSRSKSGIAALFSNGELPNGEALSDLVALLTTEFNDMQEGQIKAKQAEFRRLRTAAASHLRTLAPSALADDLRRTGNEYLRLAEAVQHAETMDSRSLTPMNRIKAYIHAAEVATEVLGTDHTVTMELRHRWETLVSQRFPQIGDDGEQQTEGRGANAQTSNRPVRTNRPSPSTPAPPPNE